MCFWKVMTLSHTVFLNNSFCPFNCLSLCPLTLNKEIHVTVSICHPPPPVPKPNSALVIHFIHWSKQIPYCSWAGRGGKQAESRGVSCLPPAPCFWSPSWRTVDLTTIWWTWQLAVAEQRGGMGRKAGLEHHLSHPGHVPAAPGAPLPGGCRHNTKRQSHQDFNTQPAPILLNSSLLNH